MGKLMPKFFVACAACASLMLTAGGCGVAQSDFDAKVTEVKNQAAKLAKSEQEKTEAAATKKKLEAAAAELNKLADGIKEELAKAKTDLKTAGDQAEAAKKGWDDEKAKTATLTEELTKTKADLKTANDQAEAAKKGWDDEKANSAALADELKAKTKKPATKSKPAAKKSADE